MTAKPDLPVIPFESREPWEAWLEEHMPPRVGCG